MANITVDIKKKSIDIGSNLVAIGKGGMSPGVYDPQEIKADVFDMDNMVDGIDKHYLTTEQIEEFEGKQDALTAGDNIDITNNVISATDTTYTAGDGISIDENNVISNTRVSAEWGNIEGDIEDQSDLQEALADKQDVISDLSEIRSNATAGKNASDTIATYGDIVTHDADEFATTDSVGEGVLTIQKNSTTINTFSANAKTDKTINITVPTQASDIGALPDTTKYAANLDLSINSSTYVITAQLKDQDGNNIGTQRTIDLPLESVVVDGEYDAETKKIILTLENGNTIEFSVADLVSGLQTEITVDNKLDADLVDDTTASHKFVTSAEKSCISTAVQPGDLTTYAKCCDIPTDNCQLDNGCGYTTCVGDMQYSDFEFVTLTGNNITLDLSSSFNPSEDFTINAPSTIKDGQVYVLIVNNGATAYTMSLGTNIINPNGADISLTPNATDQFVFVAINNKLELQKEIPQGGGGGGDMYKCDYDPNGCVADAFDYRNFHHTPEIPTDNCQLANGCGYTTCTGTLVPSDIQDLAQCCDIPTDNNQLANGCGYIKTGDCASLCYLIIDKGCGCCTQLNPNNIRVTCGLCGTAMYQDSFAILDYDEYTGMCYTMCGIEGDWGCFLFDKGCEEGIAQMCDLPDTSCLAQCCDIPTDNCELGNGCGYITGINCSDVTSALGYTPYNSTNPAGYTTCTGTLVAADIADLAQCCDIPTDNCQLANGCCYQTTTCMVNNFNSPDSQTYPTTEAVCCYVSGKISNAYIYKGTVACYECLPSTGLSNGDIYNVETEHTTAPIFPAGANLAWKGDGWDVLGGTVDLSGYAQCCDLPTDNCQLANGCGYTTCSGDVEYGDFDFVDKEGSVITLDLSSSISPTANFTINAPSVIKEGQTYILIVNNGSTAYTMALGTNVVNYSGADLTLTPSATDMFVFLGVGGVLELQPENKSIEYSAGSGINISCNEISNTGVLTVNGCSGAVCLDIPTDNCQLANGCGYTTCTGTLQSCDIACINGCLLTNGGNVCIQGGVTSVNGNTGAVTVSEFEPGNAGTTDQVLTKTASGYEWANAAGSDYSWVTKTISGGEVELGLRTIINVPTGNFTLTAPATLKDGEEYAIRIISETSYTMTLGTGFTNPRNVDTTLSGNATDQYVFLSIGGELELQPLVDTGA